MHAHDSDVGRFASCWQRLQVVNLLLQPLQRHALLLLLPLLLRHLSNAEKLAVLVLDLLLAVESGTSVMARLSSPPLSRSFKVFL